MNTLHDRFEEVAGTPGPPSRLSADQVYTTARHRRQRRAVAGVAGVVLVSALGVATAVSVVGQRSGSRAADGSGAGYGAVWSAAATDADHLYAAVALCHDRSCAGSRLLASDDGGATWHERKSYQAGAHLSVPAAGVLMQIWETVNKSYDGTATSGPKLYNHAQISTDGGHTWRDVHTVGARVAAVPAGGWTMCGGDLSVADPGSTDRPYDNCLLMAVDPSTAQAAPLATQPPGLSDGSVVSTPAAAGIWVAGHQGGDNGHPAVAVSHDRGRSWSVGTFSAAGAYAAGAYAARPGGVFTVDGRTGYAIMTALDPSAPAGPTTAPGQGRAFPAYRTTDGGKSWQPVTASEPLPQGTQLEQSYIAGNGTLMMLAAMDPPQSWYASGDGGVVYRRVTPDGLADDLTVSGIRPAVEVTPTGLYLAFAGSAVYYSIDGLHWQHSPVRAPN